jgi:ATP adenylyltransferase
MKVLWAPWRMEYILSDQKGSACIFCPGEDRTQDEANLILDVGSLTMVMMNRFPYVNGHLLVAPVRHLADMDSLTDAEMFDLFSVIRRSLGILKEVMNPEGFNVGLNLGRVAGAGVTSHLHFHIVPRWNGDTNYMTVLGEVRVIPEHVAETYHKLFPNFRMSKHVAGGDQ